MDNGERRNNSQPYFRLYLLTFRKIQYLEKICSPNVAHWAKHNKSDYIECGQILPSTS